MYIGVKVTISLWLVIISDIHTMLATSSVNNWTESGMDSGMDSGKEQCVLSCTITRCPKAGNKLTDGFTSSYYCASLAEASQSYMATGYSLITKEVAMVHTSWSISMCERSNGA